MAQSPNQNDTRRSSLVDPAEVAGHSGRLVGALHALKGTELIIWVFSGYPFCGFTEKTQRDTTLFAGPRKGDTHSQPPIGTRETPMPIPNSLPPLHLLDCFAADRVPTAYLPAKREAHPLDCQQHTWQSNNKHTRATASSCLHRFHCFAAARIPASQRVSTHSLLLTQATNTQKNHPKPFLSSATALERWSTIQACMILHAVQPT